jgi:cysteine desulfuration protein SufE
MFTACLRKQEEIKKIFSTNKESDEKYHKIIELGRLLPKMDGIFKTEENIVKGCQSVMYLRSHLNDGKLAFEADSDALISLGLAAILIFIYSDETPETVLKCPPNCLEELGLSSALSPNRANGLYSIHLKMKQDALRLLLK